MSRLALVWPGVALSLTLIDDLVAGPMLAIGAAILGPWAGIPFAMVAFTILVIALVWSAVAASRHLDPALQARVDAMIEAAAGRRFVGRFVRQVGDDHPVATAVIAAIVSPVLAVLMARLVHPGQRLHRTVIVAGVAYGLVFSLTYAAGGSLIAGSL